MNFRITNVRNTLRSQIRSQWLGELGEELVLFKAYHSLKQRHIVMLAYMSDRELMHDNYVSEFSVFRRSRSPDDRIAWIRFVRSMHRRYRVIEGEYWERLITSSAGDTRRLWSTFKDLLGGPRSSSSQTAPFTAEDFADYYESKISAIRQHTAQSHPPAISYSTATHLFVKEFYRLRRSAPSSCRSSSSRG